MGSSYTNGIIGHPLPQALVPVRTITAEPSESLDELGRSISPLRAPDVS